MQKTTPNLVKFYMEPTLMMASPEKVTWHSDMANAFTLGVNNFLTKLDFYWYGQVVGPGTTSYSMIGNAGIVLTPITFTENDIRGCCIGTTTIINLFTLLGSKLEDTLQVSMGHKIGEVFSPYILTPIQVKFMSKRGSVIAHFIKTGQECYSYIQNFDTKQQVEGKTIFYDVLDKFLVKAFNGLFWMGIASGPTSSGGVITGQGIIKPRVSISGEI